MFEVRICFLLCVKSFLNINETMEWFTTNNYITKDSNKNKLLSNRANLFSLASLFFIHPTYLKLYDYILERNITRSFIRQRRKYSRSTGAYI